MLASACFVAISACAATSAQPVAPTEPAIAPDETPVVESNETAADTTEPQSPRSEESKPSDTKTTRPVVASRVEREPLYHAGSYTLPSGAKEKRAALVELETWNHGGFVNGQKWHPVPRVVISEPSVQSGKVDRRSMMRVLRAEQYWTVRRCQDDALRTDPEMSGRAVLRLKVSGSGKIVDATPAKGATVADSRKHKKNMPAAVAKCIADGLVGAKVTAPRSKNAVVLVAVDVWPGDAGIPQNEAPATGRIDLVEVNKELDRVRGDLDRCFASADTVPAVWGRLAMQVEINEQAEITDVHEVESTFPRAETVQCVKQVLGKLVVKKTPTSGQRARVIVAHRFKQGSTTNRTGDMADPGDDIGDDRDEKVDLE